MIQVNGREIAFYSFSPEICDGTKEKLQKTHRICLINSLYFFIYTII